MATLDLIWDHARADLNVRTDRGEQDVFLWEHSERVARTAQRIAHLPDLSAHHPDEAAVLAAALYHDSGWITLLEEGRVTRLDIGTKPRFDNHRELGALRMEKRFVDILPPETLKRASTAIQTIHDRDIPLIEGQIVTEAENLNEVGMLSLWPIISRGKLDGKGIQSVIDTWRRQKEYHFWTARINDSFRFQAVKELARQRLTQFDRLMEELEEQHDCLDLV